MSLILNGSTGITSSGGVNVLQPNAVVTANLQDSSVTDVKIANLAVTEAKLASNAVTTAKIADSNVTTAKIANSAVTDAKIADVAATKLTGNVAAARITDALNASGSAPVYACRAWVNFNGTGTVAIRASGNVSSITDNGTGDYTVNFTTAMPDVNYAFAAGANLPSGLFQRGVTSSTGYQTTSSLRLNYITGSTAQGLSDTDVLTLAIFR